MNKFRKIKNKPLKSLDDLNLNVVKEVDYGTVVLDTEKAKLLNQLLNHIYKNPETNMVGIEIDDEVYLSNQLKSSSNRKNLHTFPEPNPTIIYYNIANENLEKSAKLKNKIISKEENFKPKEKFEMFTEYFSLTSQGIIFLITTVESFLNQFFEDNEYLINGYNKTKKDLEWSKLEEKINDIIPALLDINFKNLHNNEYQQIINTNILRNDLIHLKRVENENNTWYQDLIKQLLDYNQYKSSEAVFKLLDTLKPNYFETQNNSR